VPPQSPARDIGTEDTDLVILGYGDRLTDDHAVLLRVAQQHGLNAILIAPSQVSLHIDATGEHVRVDGQRFTPRAVLPRGINRPWPMMKQVLECWYSNGAAIVPSVNGADICADKITTTRALSRAGVPILPTTGIVPGPDVSLDALRIVADTQLLAKPARGSKARGIHRFDSVESAMQKLSQLHALQAGMVDHHVVQPVASAAGVDYRIVVAGRVNPRVVAATQRTAPLGEFVTNRQGANVIDFDDRLHEIRDVVDVACRAVQALDLAFGGVDIIMHHGRAVVLEVNAWPGLAVEHRGDAIANALIDEVMYALNTTDSSHVASQRSPR
jgi:glutathione synthase/RimK-type ligase-like ATP-grasp enzyme